MSHNLKIFDPFRDDFIDNFFGNRNLSIFNDKQKFFNYPKINISDNGKEIIVTANTPGISAKDITINVEDNTLTISGHTEREEEEGKKDSDFYRFEREEGSFMRTIELPSNVNKDNVDAKTKNGVLTITLKKQESEDKSKIQIREE